MTIPKSFKWSEIDIKKLNTANSNEKRAFLKKEELNIRQSIGEAVPTVIFQQVASKVKNISTVRQLPLTTINHIIAEKNLAKITNLLKYIDTDFHNHSLEDMLKIAELSNAKRLENAAFYTRKDICFTLIKELPEYPKSKKILNIIEPSVGIGNFLPLLFRKYEDIETVNLDLIDIDRCSLKILKKILKKIKIPKNFNINLINQDFLLNNYDKSYDISIGNPPFGKVTKNKNLLREYKKNKYNQKTNNVFSYFIEECLKISDITALISPKSLLSAPAYSDTRKLLSNYKFKTIIDYGEKGFPGVKIETMSFIVHKKTAKNSDDLVKIESYISDDIRFMKENYAFDKKFPTWLIYRNVFFDTTSEKLKFNIFDAFRDRQITKKHTSAKGNIRVLKSRNIGSNQINNIDGYDCYIEKIDAFSVKKYINKKQIVLVPNLTYNPRACFLPKNSIADGSVALLTPIDRRRITKKDLKYFDTEEFSKFYAIARNYGTRSLNIDKSSVYFFGILNT